MQIHAKRQTTPCTAHAHTHTAQRSCNTLSRPCAPGSLTLASGGARVASSKRTRARELYGPDWRGGGGGGGVATLRKLPRSARSRASSRLAAGSGSLSLARSGSLSLARSGSLARARSGCRACEFGIEPAGRRMPISAAAPGARPRGGSNHEAQLSPTSSYKRLERRLASYAHIDSMRSRHCQRLSLNLKRCRSVYLLAPSANTDAAAMTHDARVHTLTRGRREANGARAMRVGARARAGRGQGEGRARAGRGQGEGNA